MAVCIPSPTLTLFSTGTSTTIVTTSTVTVQTLPGTTSCLSSVAAGCAASTVIPGKSGQLCQPWESLPTLFALHTSLRDLWYLLMYRRCFIGNGTRNYHKHRYRGKSNFDPIRQLFVYPYERRFPS